MKYSLGWLLGKIEKGEKVKYLFFWGHGPDKNEIITSSCLSQWWESPFKANEITYLTAEHWMMAEKARLFEDSDSLKKILSAPTPGAAKALGREVNNFNNALWEEKRYEIVVKGSVYKFGQNEDIKHFLLSTGDRVLVEASPVDFIWGIGLSADSEKSGDPSKWNGLNLLGFALMEARDLLRGA